MENLDKDEITIYNLPEDMLNIIGYFVDDYTNYKLYSTSKMFRIDKIIEGYQLYRKIKLSSMLTNISNHSKIFNDNSLNMIAEYCNFGILERVGKHRWFKITEIKMDKNEIILHLEVCWTKYLNKHSGKYGNSLTCKKEMICHVYIEKIIKIILESYFMYNVWNM